MAIVTKETAKYVFHETQTILGGADWNAGITLFEAVRQRQ